MKKCQKRASGSKTFEASDDEGPPEIQMDSRIKNVRNPNQDIYFWPNLSEKEQNIIKDAFNQIQRRTCLKFNVLNYKPWYHADRWESDKPYVIIRKSKKLTGYSDNDIEEINRRSVLYITEDGLNNPSFNMSRGIIMNQIVRFMGLKEELYRPDSASYVRAIKKEISHRNPAFSNAQLQWPFDPESITVPFYANNKYKLTRYCPARKTKDLGAGQRVGLLTRWDAVKINSMYCPQSVGFADPRMGPCVVERKTKKVITSFKK
uniref:Peptidase M12A domain-containing protein n=1 Tax=Panagrolaimus sp. ES5 TaxID=591445 RepID=A0AC34F417_9BILA